MPSNDVSHKSLSELAAIVNGGSTSDAQLANAVYEIGYREDLIEFAAKGGDHPTYSPPNP